MKESNQYWDEAAEAISRLELVEPNALPRSDGKATRLIDRRSQ